MQTVKYVRVQFEYDLTLILLLLRIIQSPPTKYVLKEHIKGTESSRARSGGLMTEPEV